MLKEFLVKAAYTPWVRNNKPAITNSDSLFESASQDALAKLKFNAQLNTLKRTDPKQYEYLMNLPSNIYTDEAFMNPAQKNLASLESDQAARQYNSSKSVGLPFMPEVTIDVPKIPREIENYAQALQQLPQTKARLNDSIRTSANTLLERINPNYSVKPPFAGIKPVISKLDPTAIQVQLPKAIKNTTIEPTNIDSFIANADLNGVHPDSSPTSTSTAGTVNLDNLPDFNPNDSLQDGTYIPPVMAPDINRPKPSQQVSTTPITSKLDPAAEQVAKQYNSSKSVGRPFMPKVTIDPPKISQEIENYAKSLQQAPVKAPAISAEQTSIKTPVSSNQQISAKTPAISAEQARQLLARGITPTSIGGYAQFLGADGSNPQANGFIARMDANPNYNPFAKTKRKYIDKLQGVLADPSYDPQVIHQRNINTAASQTRKDAERRIRMQTAQQMAAQGNTGAQNYLNYMRGGKSMTTAGQQFVNTYNTNSRRLQQRRQQTAKPFVNTAKWNSVLDGPRPIGENAAMRKALGYPDTGSGAGSHAAANKWIAKNNTENGV